MHVDAPIGLMAAGYRSLDGAAQDFASVWAARDDGGFHHTSVALLTKDHEANLQVERSNNTAKHIEWGGAPLGAALSLLAQPAGIALLTRVGMSGVGAMIEHFRQQAGPEGLAELATVLDAAACGLVVVVLNRGSAALTPLLENAEQCSSVDMVWADLQEELSRDFARSSSGAVLVAI